MCWNCEISKSKGYVNVKQYDQLHIGIFMLRNVFNNKYTIKIFQGRTKNKKSWTKKEAI